MWRTSCYCMWPACPHKIMWHPAVHALHVCSKTRMLRLGIVKVANGMDPRMPAMQW